MALIIQKYGGSSLANNESIKKIALRIAQLKQEGHALVVVVSAQAGVTSALLEKAKSINPEAKGHLLDMLLVTGEQSSSVLLALALEKLGVSVVVKTAWKTAIYTDETHNNANIRHIDTSAYFEALKANSVVIVSGFQGISPTGHLTTLGLGGSDLTAIALAHFLKADCCQLLKTVGSVLRVDPNWVTNEDCIETLSYNQACVFARLGANIIQEKAAEFAKKHAVSFEISHPYNISTKRTDIASSYPYVWGLAVRQTKEKNRISIMFPDPSRPLPIPNANHFRDLGIPCASFLVAPEETSTTVHFLYNWLSRGMAS